MNVGVLTFHFAHNYGAVLQAYSLVEYLSSLGVNAEIIDYRPASMADEYSLSPLKATSFKSGIKRALDIPYVSKQHKLFDSFIADDLRLSRPVHDESELSKCCQGYDCLMVGSDQVWNLDLTGGDGAYFLHFPLGDAAAYSYAASFGKNTLGDIPRAFLDSLRKFKAISLRENTCAEELERLIGIQPVQVVDPVFLHDASFWGDQGEAVKLEKPYCLFYALQENRELMSFAEANTNGLPLYSIHPTAVKQPVGRNLNGVGPRQFLSIVAGADRIFTNSFHGLAFSAIFGRDTYTAFHSSLGSRSATLLQLFGIDAGNQKGIVHADFADADRDGVDELIRRSKAFLALCVEKDGYEV